MDLQSRYTFHIAGLTTRKIQMRIAKARLLTVEIKTIIKTTGLVASWSFTSNLISLGFMVKK
jgi:hypothetical protein